MIPKFEDFIKEGFLSKTYDRYRTGEDRIENKISTNVINLKEVDLGNDIPFYFSNEELYINDENKFTLDELIKYLENIKFENGWRLPTYDDIYDLYKYWDKDNIDIEFDKFNQKEGVSFINKSNNDTFTVKLPSGFTVYVITSDDGYRFWFFDSQSFYQYRKILEEKDMSMYDKNVKVRLIKNK